jgi:hypothetical protein
MRHYGMQTTGPQARITRRSNMIMMYTARFRNVRAA